MSMYLAALEPSKSALVQERDDCSARPLPLPLVNLLAVLHVRQAQDAELGEGARPHATNPFGLCA